ncbi:MAG: AMP-binding protein [Micromonosporaceae bacterium]
MIYSSPYRPIAAKFAAVPHLVRSAASRGPEQPALIGAGSGAVVSYATLAARIDRVAASLAERGFSPGDVLAVRAPNIPPWAGGGLGGDGSRRGGDGHLPACHPRGGRFAAPGRRSLGPGNRPLTGR